MKEILQLFVCFFEIYIPHWYIGKFFGKRKLPCVQNILWYICLLIWIGLLYYQRTFALYSRIYLLIEMVGAIWLGKWKFQIKWKDVIIVISIFYESLYLLYLLAIAAEGYNNGLGAILKMQTEMTLQGVLLSLLMLFFLSSGFYAIFRMEKRIISVKEITDQRLLLVPILIHFTLYFCDKAFYHSERIIALKSVFLGTVVCIGLFLALIIYFVVKIGEYEVHILEKRAEAAEQKYKERVEGDRNRDILVHDIQNHLMVIKSILENKETDRAKEYIEKMQEDYCNIKKIFHTGNVVIDTILVSKSCVAEEAGISMKIISDNLSGTFVSDRDGCSILANLIDNAVEACEKVEGQRWIKIRLENRVWGVIWKIENSCLDTADCRNASKRPEKRRGIRHGTGLQSVRYAIQKYDGLLIQKREEHIFSTTVILYKE